MTRTFRHVGMAALLAGAGFSQTSGVSPAFEAADVHVSAAQRNPYKHVWLMRGGRYDVRQATMLDLITLAYGVTPEKVVGGPSWLEMDRFDVVAKAPAGVTKETSKAMLKALLADRFQLVIHNDTRPIQAFALRSGKKPALKPSDGSGDTGCKMTVEGVGASAPPPPPPPGGTAEAPPMRVPTFVNTCRNMTMAAFAEAMRDMPLAQQYLGENSVVDETGLKGAWDFTFRYSLRAFTFGPNASAATVSMADAVEKQLGLKLDAVKVPLAVLVVDSVNQKATANSPGAIESLKGFEAPTEFEVADVKPTAPDATGMRFNILPTGRVDMTGVPMKFLIAQAWNITDDMLVGAPKWLDTDRFDIIAKAPITAISDEPSSGPGRGPDVDYDAVLVMLRGLLADRFKLTTHIEDRPMEAYTLVSLKPKMKKADPASRTRFKEGAGLDAKDPRNSNPVLSRLVTCENMTMTQFAAQLQNIAPGYIHSPVLDATGLEGSFDFTLSFSPAGMAGGRGGRGGMAGPGPGGPGEASDPSGAVTLFEAMEKQLGLKLEMQKRPVSVLVIDRIEQKPTEN